MLKFLQWWKIAGQFWGFVLHIGLLSGLLIGFMDDMRVSEWLSLGWLVLFFSGAIWYSWQMRVHGWRLPKNIKETH
jgi:hypothetical protein